ncbi:hypothetical protein IQ264_15705 [Phormidium sp. LEGE 05292]|uniref:hypothetical protein n=1 Tax=[Phormidium] sp. LEGE 05292 TaxID=767427 RepID=UPI00187F3A5F|nr:hypothetical protein [Phormidium sp. LEGE 05292]MBE9226872.1 hypothetical protein [Phormidium sp. LEGE 05292]
MGTGDWERQKAEGRRQKAEGKKGRKKAEVKIPLVPLSSGGDNGAKTHEYQ